jgi:GNAT superfamily N-acetyltransferase
MASLEIRAAPLEDIRILRHLVLRPHQRPEDIVYEHDADADALHLGAYLGGALVAVASIARDTLPPDLGGPSGPAAAWRVRGMATLREHRGVGSGGALLERCVEHARSHGATVVWLNGRVPARAFYERHGFVASGDVFELAGLGPHLRFSRPFPRDVERAPTLHR